MLLSTTGLTGFTGQVSADPDGGEGEIRTLDGPVTHNGFRDRRLQPLGHLSESRWMLKMAVPTGFEPAFSALTGPRVWPGYTTGPAAAKSTNGPELDLKPETPNL
jgi:hypothetical protein